MHLKMYKPWKRNSYWKCNGRSSYTKQYFMPCSSEFRHMISHYQNGLITYTITNSLSKLDTQPINGLTVCTEWWSLVVKGEVKRTFFTADRLHRQDHGKRLSNNDTTLDDSCVSSTWPGALNNGTMENPNGHLWVSPSSLSTNIKGFGDHLVDWCASQTWNILLALRLFLGIMQVQEFKCLFIISLCWFW